LKRATGTMCNDNIGLSSLYSVEQWTELFTKLSTPLSMNGIKPLNSITNQKPLYSMIPSMIYEIMAPVYLVDFYHKVAIL
jgi:hypothetical protein